MPTPVTSQIWFGIRSVDAAVGSLVTGTTAQVAVLDDNSDFATRMLLGNLVDQGGIQLSQLLAFTGTTAQQTSAGIDLTDFQVDGPTSSSDVNTGDLVVGSGVVAHNLADMNGNGRMTNTSGIDRSNDPVSITGHGKASAAILSGDMTDGWVTFSNDKGFGFVNGSGWESTATSHRLNDGDSVTFDVASGNFLKFASFVVRTNGTAANVVIDSDGRMIADTNGALFGGFVQDDSAGELDLGALNDGDLVKIDFDLGTISINDADFGDASAFFTAFNTAGGDVLTLGSLVGTGGAWSADDLILTTMLDGPDPGPGFGLLSFDFFTSMSDPAPGGLLNGRLYAYFDLDENGTLDVGEVPGAENLGQMREGWFELDDPADSDDNPVQGTGVIDWVDIYTLGRANTHSFAAPSQIQYGEPVAFNSTAPGPFGLWVNTGTSTANITGEGPNGSPGNIDPTEEFLPDDNYGTIELGEVLGIVLKTAPALSARIVVNAVTDQAAQDSEPDVDMLVRLYNDSTLLQEFEIDLALGTNTVDFTDNFNQLFNRMEIAATGSMNLNVPGENYGARFAIQDIDILGVLVS